MLRSIGLSLLLTACAGAGPSPSVVPGQPWTMVPGQQVSLPEGGGHLRFTGVRSDSRCPADVQCIHAGEAIVVFELQAASQAPATLVLSTESLPADASAGDWQMRMLSLDRGAQPAAKVVLQRKP